MAILWQPYYAEHILTTPVEVMLSRMASGSPTRGGIDGVEGVLQSSDTDSPEGIIHPFIYPNPTRMTYNSDDKH